MGPGAGPSALGNVYRQAGGFPEHGGRRKRSRRDPFFDASIAAGVSGISFNRSGPRGAGTIGPEYANPSRLRVDLRMSSTHSDDSELERPLLARIGYSHS